MPQELLTDNQVLNEVRVLVRKNKVVWTTHAEQRMAERGYERGQVKDCLLSGCFFERPYHPNRVGDLQYQFALDGNVDGEPIRVVASLIPEKKVVVISVIDPN